MFYIFREAPADPTVTKFGLGLDFVDTRGLRVNGFCYPTRPVAKSLLPDPTRTCGLVTRPDLNSQVWVGSSKPADTGGPADL